MLKHKLILTSLLMIIVSAIGLADISAPNTYPNKPAGTDRIIVLKAAGNRTARPRVPSRQVIECSYDGEFISFTFEFPEGECELTLTAIAGGLEQTYTFDSSVCSFEVLVGELPETILTLTTEAGHTYTAELLAE